MKMGLTFWELGTEAFTVLTVIWPEANIDDVCWGCNGRRPGYSTDFTQEWRWLMRTIMDLERWTWFSVIHWSVTSRNHKCWAWNGSHADRKVSYSQSHSQKHMRSDFLYPDQWSWRRPDALHPLWWPRSSPHCQDSGWDTAESGSLHWGLWQSLHILHFQREDFKKFISRKLK